MLSAEGMVDYQSNQGAKHMTEHDKALAARQSPASNLTGRPLAIFNEIHARNGIWEAYDQGRMAHAQGEARFANPWNRAPLNTHICTSDWFRGWDAEAAYVRP